MLRLALPAAALALLLPAAPPAGAETIFLRNSIGPDSSTTNGNFAFNTTEGGGTWFHTPFPLTPRQPSRLVRFRGIAGQLGNAIVWSDFDVFINVWSSQPALDATPAPDGGDVLSIRLPSISPPPVAYGLVDTQSSGVHASVEIVVDLAPFGVIIPGGETWFLTVGLRTRTGATTSGTAGWLECTQPGVTDVSYRQQGPPIPLATLPTSLHDGRLAFEVTAELVAESCPGDANGDGVVNFADLNIVLSEYGEVSLPGVLQGDVDHDGDVDFVDLNIVLSALGTSC